MGFFKDLKNKARGLRSQVQPPMSPQMPPPFMRRRQAPGTVLDLETGLPPARPPLSNLRNIGNSVRRSPQIMPERRMPQQRPSNRFFGGGLGSIFSRLPQFMERFEDQRGRQGMSPPLPRAPLPMPQDMPMERFPMMRPGFAEGEDVDINMIIAEQGAREGMSPPEMAAQRMREFLGETGRTVSDRDIELFSVGMLTLEDIIDRAEPVTNRNLEQQEQMFFPESGNTFTNDRDRYYLDDLLADLEKKN